MYSKSRFYILTAVLLSRALWSSAAPVTEATEPVTDSVATNKAVVVDSLAATNDVAAVKAVEAMTVEEQDEAEEAAEVAEVVRRAETERKAATPETIDPWKSFEPPVDSNYDWVQLTSGEWLKGDFKVLYDFVLEFDSKELDLLELDFEDVQKLRTRAMKTVFIEGDGGRRDTDTLRGVLEIDGDQVVLRRSEHEVSIPRDKIISIASGRQREKDYWSGALSIGANARSGNSDTVDATVEAVVRRRTAKTRFEANYFANYSESQDVEIANDHRLTSFHDWFLTGHFYWKTVELELYRDPFINIDAQYSISTGVGYDILRTPRTEWTVNTGLGYQKAFFYSVQPGEAESSDSPFFTTGTRIDHSLTKTVDFFYDYSMRWLNKDNGQYTHQMRATISFDLMKNFDFDVSAIWDRIEKPQEDENGVLPEQDDLQFILSLTHDF